MSNGMVQVLLSTYNGEKYISQQLDSIFAQSYDHIKILIRDDGSSDATVSLIKQYIQQYPGQIEFIAGDNIGVIKSFWTLMEQADQSVEYFCFCDQDDVWMKNKVDRAVEHINRLAEQANPLDEIPIMIFTATQLTNENLEPTAIWPESLEREPSFYNALFQNIAVGATITFNRKALQDIQSVSVNTSHILMHDWWLYLTISCMGKVYFDPIPSIYYRQHASNAVGGEATFIQKFKKRIDSFKKHGNHKLLVQQAIEFNRLYVEKIRDNEMLEQLEAFIKPRERWSDRIHYLRKCKLYRQSKMENYLFRFLIMIGYV